MLSTNVALATVAELVTVCRDTIATKGADMRRLELAQYYAAMRALIDDLKKALPAKEKGLNDLLPRLTGAAGFAETGTYLQHANEAIRAIGRLLSN